MEHVAQCYNTHFPWTRLCSVVFCSEREEERKGKMEVWKEKAGKAEGGEEEQWSGQLAEGRKCITIAVPWARSQQLLVNI